MRADNVYKTSLAYGMYAYSVRGALLRQAYVRNAGVTLTPAPGVPFRRPENGRDVPRKGPRKHLRNDDENNKRRYLRGAKHASHWDGRPDDDQHIAVGQGVDVYRALEVLSSAKIQILMYFLFTPLGNVPPSASGNGH
ncbi:uncharacterized protein SPSK_10659 [Sporothrix schenckii 1099-18]|uniref:Uncharacterized protein n=1 Tax=Sporothrix schenckii 1099-18 TaxID=1397361 RepID=A0A0F2LX48_SPOSC|nr:uncharacterized protein SPSK_10659 [Sporothrix schenckii 1099-18]KJR80461.1 hypothetical protein SPSK_10659 [Sporothrix schenckii 1099-18]